MSFKVRIIEGKKNSEKVRKQLLKLLKVEGKKPTIKVGVSEKDAFTDAELCKVRPVELKRDWLGETKWEAVWEYFPVLPWEEGAYYTVIEA